VGVPDNGIDFSTGWTLVDMRRDARTQETHVVLMDPSGRLHTRDVRSDANSPEYKQMTAEATAAAASGAPGDSVAGANGR
jgi:hypothetical protein